MLAALPGLMLLVWSAPATAAPLTLRIDTDKAAINEYFQLTIQVNARHVQLVVPDTDDFRVVDATSPFDQPMFCMNMGTSVVSGPCVFRYRFYPKKAGKLTVPEFRIVDDFFDPGRIVGRSEPFEVEVSETPADSEKSRQPAPGKSPRSQGGRRSGGRGHRMQQPHGMQNGGPSIPQPTENPVTPAELRKLDQFAQHDIFLLPVIERDFVYLNEPFVIDFLLYVAENSGASSIQGLELPELEGFRKEEVKVEQSELPRTMISGRAYQVFVLSRYVLLPMEAGTRTLTSATATVLASTSSYQQFGGNGFAITFNSGSQPVEVVSPPVALDVREVPAGAPAGFEPPNVGRFALRHLEVPPPQPAGSWVVLKFEIQGDGNLLTLALPELAVHPDIETRSGAVDNDAVKLDELGIHGVLKVQIPFRVKRPGKLNLPPLRLVSFDPKTEEFKTSELKLPELVAQVPAGDESTGPAPSEQDIEGILADVPLDGDCRTRSVLDLNWVAAWTAGVPAVYLILLLVRWLLRLAGRDNGRRQARAAATAARKELSEASRKAAAGSSAEFFAAVSRALVLCLEGRFRISAASATVGEVEAALLRLGVPPELARQTREEIEAAQFGRFAPTALQQADIQATLKRVETLLYGLDRVRPRPQAPGRDGRTS